MDLGRCFGAFMDSKQQGWIQHFMNSIDITKRSWNQFKVEAKATKEAICVWKSFWPKIILFAR